MLTAEWLVRDRVLLDAVAADLDGVLRAAAPLLARDTGLPAPAIEGALRDAARKSDVAAGSGVAIPHVEMPGLERTVVALVRLSAPIDIHAIDGAPADLFFVTLFRPGDASGHLALLAHLARLAQSRTFREGLRQARDPDQVITLVQAAEARQAVRPGTLKAAPVAAQVLAIVTIAGERAVDSALVELLEEEMGDARILDAQTVREAARREVPLFAGFRDIFGDPGGARVILVAIPTDRVDALASLVRRVCEERDASAGEILVVPVLTHWTYQRPSAPPSRSGH